MFVSRQEATFLPANDSSVGTAMPNAGVVSLMNLFDGSIPALATPRAVRRRGGQRHRNKRGGIAPSAHPDSSQEVPGGHTAGTASAVVHDHPDQGSSNAGTSSPSCRNSWQSRPAAVSTAPAAAVQHRLATITSPAVSPQPTLSGTCFCSQSWHCLRQH